MEALTICAKGGLDEVGGRGASDYSGGVSLRLDKGESLCVDNVLLWNRGTNFYIGFL